jgi:hypothetical protein
MPTWIGLYTFNNMIQKAWSTHPRPWTAFTKGANLRFAPRSIANVLLIFVFRGDVPLAACPLLRIHGCLHQFMVNKSSLSACTDVCNTEWIFHSFFHREVTSAHGDLFVPKDVKWWRTTWSKIVLQNSLFLNYLTTTCDLLKGSISMTLSKMQSFQLQFRPPFLYFL